MTHFRILMFDGNSETDFTFDEVTTEFNDKELDSEIKEGGH